MSKVTSLDHHRKRRRGAEMEMLADGSWRVARTYFLPDDEAKLLDEHEAEAERHGAEFYNFGWGNGDNFICSKTSKGVLTTTIDRKTMEVPHSWKSWQEFRAMLPQR
jgi:hypothetical protein